MSGGRLPRSIRLKVDGTYVRISATHLNYLNKFDHNDEYCEFNPDPILVRAAGNHGWTLRTRGRFVLTERGKLVRQAFQAYLARKENNEYDADDGNSSPVEL